MKIKHLFEKMINNNDQFNHYLLASLEQDKIIVSRRTAYVGALLVGFFALVDIVSAQENLGLYLIIRFFMTGIILSIVYMTYFYKRFFLKNYSILIPSVYLLNACGLIAMIYFSEKGTIVDNTYFVGIIFVILVLWSWVYLSVKASLFISLSIILSYLVMFIAKYDISNKEYLILFFVHMIFLIASLVIGLINDILRKHYLFKSFLANTRFKETLLSKQNDECRYVSILEFQKIMNDRYFDAKVTNLNIYLYGIKFDNLNLKQKIESIFKKHSTGEHCLFEDANSLWSIGFSEIGSQTLKPMFNKSISERMTAQESKLIEMTIYKLNYVDENSRIQDLIQEASNNFTLIKEDVSERPKLSIVNQ